VRGRRRLGALLLAGASVVVALALVEAVGAWLAAGRCGGGQAPLWRPDPTTGWALIPGRVADVTVCRQNEPLATHRVRVNALGHRDRRRSYARRPGVPRVLLLGDSFVEAVQVDLADTFAVRVERRLGVEMLNAGVSGYATDGELRAFRAEGRRYRPDLVLLVFYVGNDVLENGPRLYLKNPHGLPPKPWLRVRGDAGPALRACLVAHRTAARLAGHVPAPLWTGLRTVRFALVRGVDAALGALCDGATGPALIDGVPELLGVYGAPRTPAWVEAWRESERLLLRLARSARASGADFAVVVAPAAQEYVPEERRLQRLRPRAGAVAWAYDYPHRRLAAFLAAHAIPSLSLREPLERHFRETGRCGCYPWDGHWDAEGHGVVADALEPFVRQRLRLRARMPPSSGEAASFTHDTAAAHATRQLHRDLAAAHDPARVTSLPLGDGPDKGCAPWPSRKRRTSSGTPAPSHAPTASS
jgi:hypothetical protein